MNENLDSAIALTLELEGLLMLLRERGEMAPDEITYLINDKLGRLNTSLTHISLQPSERPTASVMPGPVSGTHESEPQPELSSQPVENESIILQLRQRMTLNDKFLFRRELFDNDESRFNENLQIIESIGDAGDIKDYLYNDLCLDPDNPVVIQFVSLVENAMSNH